MLKNNLRWMAIAAIVAGSLSACAGDQGGGGGGGGRIDGTMDTDDRAGGVTGGGVQEPINSDRK